MCNARLNFTAGGPTELCYNYSITDDSVCELGPLQTFFKVELAISDNGVVIDQNAQLATIIIDDNNEPECCKARVLTTLAIICC